jgi:hypothetical protein
MRIAIENEDPDNDQSLFEIKLGEAVVAQNLTATEAHIVVGEIFERSLRHGKRDDNSKALDAAFLRGTVRA